MAELDARRLLLCCRHSDEIRHLLAGCGALGGAAIVKIQAKVGRRRIFLRRSDQRVHIALCVASAWTAVGERPDRLLCHGDVVELFHNCAGKATVLADGCEIAVNALPAASEYG